MEKFLKTFFFSFSFLSCLHKVLTWINSSFHPPSFQYFIVVLFTNQREIQVLLCCWKINSMRLNWISFNFDFSLCSRDNKVNGLWIPSISSFLPSSHPPSIYSTYFDAPDDDKCILWVEFEGDRNSLFCFPIPEEAIWKCQDILILFTSHIFIWNCCFCLPYSDEVEQWNGFLKWI